MSAEELRGALKLQPFGPFRLVMTDGVGYEIRHPDLLWVGRRSAMIGLTGEPAQTFYERAVQVNLRHVIKLEPLESARSSPSNGST